MPHRNLRAAIASGDAFGAGFGERHLATVVVMMVATTVTATAMAMTAATAVMTAKMTTMAMVMMKTTNAIVNKPMADLLAKTNEAPMEDEPPWEIALPTPIGIPNLALARQLTLPEIQAIFSNPECILRSSEGRSTFDNHQRRNTMLILFLYREKPNLLEIECYHELQDVDTRISYQSIIFPF